MYEKYKYIREKRGRIGTEEFSEKYLKNIYVEKSNTFTPEEARNINGSIVILKINDK